MIERCASVEQPGWLALRQALWPHCTLEEHRSEMASFIASPQRFAQFVSYPSSRQAVGQRHREVAGRRRLPVGVHGALGFEETERVAYFRRAVPGP